MGTSQTLASKTQKSHQGLPTQVDNLPWKALQRLTQAPGGGGGEGFPQESPTCLQYQLPQSMPNSGSPFLSAQVPRSCSSVAGPAVQVSPHEKQNSQQLEFAVGFTSLEPEAGSSLPSQRAAATGSRRPLGPPGTHDDYLGCPKLPKLPIALI